MYKVLKNAIAEETCLILSEEMRIARDNNIENGDLTNMGGLIQNCFGIFATGSGESLLSLFTKAMENETGKKLYPTYSYTRIYGKGSFLKPHTDKNPCEYSVSICLSKKGDWPIFFDGEPLELEVGDAVAYEGIKHTHWREEFEGEEHIQLFMHYVDANGKYSHLKYDCRDNVGLRYRNIPKEEYQTLTNAIL